MSGLNASIIIKAKVKTQSGGSKGRRQAQEAGGRGRRQKAEGAKLKAERGHY